MKTIKLNLPKRSYDIIVGHKILPKLSTLLKKLDIGTHAIIVTNPNIYRMHARPLLNHLNRGGIHACCEIVPDSESSKSFASCLKLITKISQHDGLNKKLFLIAFGGGVVGDLTGFAASIYKRGIPYVQIPTTLLAQVDSAIGGKTAIDLAVGKNLVGAFYQPRLVFSDVSMLSSLPARQVRAGLAEIIKYGVIYDAKLFAYLEKNYKKVLRLI